MIKTNMTRISYCVDVSSDIWEILNGIDTQGDDNSDWIMKEMKDLGADDIDWNGHFGMCVFFSIDCDDNIELTLKRIEQYIENFSS